MSFSDFDSACMSHALALAKQAALKGEVPVGAVLAVENDVIAVGHNQPITHADPTAHAEIVALRHACEKLNNYRLPANACLYVTLEPCTMCVGALIHARLPRLVYATTEPRAGAVVSAQNLSTQSQYNHIIHCQGGLMADESAQILKAFFKERRKK